MEEFLEIIGTITFKIFMCIVLIFGIMIDHKD
jgi:hypothetical protein